MLTQSLGLWLTLVREHWIWEEHLGIFKNIDNDIFNLCICITKEDDTIGGVVRTLESPIVKTFAKYGWGWGGRYGDYMHFSKANGG